MKNKICTQCKILLPLSSFQKQIGAKDGLRSACGKCRSEKGRIYYEKCRVKINKRAKEYQQSDKGRSIHDEANRRYRERNREMLREKDKSNRKLNPLPSMLSRIKGKAKRENKKFNLTIDDLNMPPFCPVLGIPLEVASGKHKQNSPSLDRIDNTKGYIKGNVIIVSNKVNMTKNAATVEELGKIYRFYKELELTSIGTLSPGNEETLTRDKLEEK